MKPLFLFLFLFLSLFSNSTVSAQTISPGSTLTVGNPDQSWTSPNSLFSFRFIADVNNRDTHFAAITYDGIPVWVAGGSSANGSAADSTASLQFLTDGNLRLVNGSNGAVVWQSNTAGRGVSSATLEDSGNFVLRNGTVSIWSTFENPTETLLPNQNFTVGNVLRSGSYSFNLHGNGNLTLRWNDSIEYWNLRLNSSINTNLSSPTLMLQLNGLFSLFDPILPSSITMVHSSDYGDDIPRFVKLDNDGNLRIYSSTGGSGTNNVRWAAVSDQCQVFGYCGNMGICSYENSNPICRCLSKNFVPIDPKDSRKGCKRKMEIEDCPDSATMLELDNAQLLTYPPDVSSQFYTLDIRGCRSNCLASGTCVASTSLADGTGVCYLKQPQYFISGFQSPAVPSTSFVKVCGPVDPYPLASSRKNQQWRLHGWVVAVIIVGTLLGLVALEGSLWWLCCRNSPKHGTLRAQYALLEYASGAPVQFSYKELQQATKGFREKLGAGGFGAVYRGVLVNRTIVAVKQLEGIEQGEKQFRMEVATISSTHHLNLVRLIGFCSEGRHRLLVYEFMRNGSLDNFLFSTEDNNQSSKILNWEYRFKIALGTAKGITYLHEECRDCIVHCDIKPENILLDENYNSKVSDFGLAKLIKPVDHRRTMTSVRGTRGYLAPEWLANLPITSKSDIFSYGMVLLEIVSGRRNFEVSQETNRKKFSSWAYEEFEKGNFDAIIDKRLRESEKSNEVDIEQVKRAIQVSFWCIQEQPSQRPMMSKVVQMLEGIMEIEKPPAPIVVVEGSVSGAGANVTSSVSAFSTFAASAPDPSSTSSFQTTGISSFSSGKYLDRRS